MYFLLLFDWLILGDLFHVSLNRFLLLVLSCYNYYFWTNNYFCITKISTHINKISLIGKLKFVLLWIIFRLFTWKLILPAQFRSHFIVFFLCWCVNLNYMSIYKSYDLLGISTPLFIISFGWCIHGLCSNESES